jgi:hypothetical protein
MRRTCCLAAMLRSRFARPQTHCHPAALNPATSSHLLLRSKCEAIRLGLPALYNLQRILQEKTKYSPFCNCKFAVSCVFAICCKINASPPNQTRQPTPSPQQQQQQQQTPIAELWGVESDTHLLPRINVLLALRATSHTRFF